MKHLKEARKHLDNGQYREALSILDRLLTFAPHNPEALRLKAKIYDAHGRFAESLQLLKQAVRYDLNVAHDDLRARLDDDAEEAMLYRQESAAGVIYSPCHMQQTRIAGFGLLGALLTYAFILAPVEMSPLLHSVILLSLFVGGIVTPSLILLWLYMSQVRKVVVNSSCLSFVVGRQLRSIPWKQVACVKLLADTQNPYKFLQLIFYKQKNTNVLPTSTPSESGFETLCVMDVSEASSMIKARRHFVQDVISRCPIVVYGTLQGTEDAVVSISDAIFN